MMILRYMVPNTPSTTVPVPNMSVPNTYSALLDVAGFGNGIDNDIIAAAIPIIDVADETVPIHPTMIPAVPSLFLVFVEVHDDVGDCFKALTRQHTIAAMDKMVVNIARYIQNPKVRIATHS